MHPATSAETLTPAGSSLAGALDRLWSDLPRLRAILPGGPSSSTFLSHAAALRFLLHAGGDRPLLTGLVGGASCGKSTIFDSLVGDRLSRIHYQPHSSFGPILYAHEAHRARLLPAGLRRFLPEFRAVEIEPDAEPVSGQPDTISLAFHSDPVWRGVALVDLPDMSSESARREGWQVRRLMPWLDLVIWVVDPNDYLFEDLYIDLIDEVASSGQHAIVVVNDIHGQVGAGNRVLADRVAQFRAAASFVLPRLECSARDPYPLFNGQDDFARLRGRVGGFTSRRPLGPLVARVRREAGRVQQANEEWARRVRELSVQLERRVGRARKPMLASAPILSVLPEPAREELERLRNRLSLWHHGKRLFGALRAPSRLLSRKVVQRFQVSPADLDTGPLYRHLIGALKELGIDLHRVYLESGLVRRMQQHDPPYEVRGLFDPETLAFRDRLDELARHLLAGTQELLSDPSLWKDKRFHLAAGATSIAVVFLLVESMLGVPGISLLVGKGVAALVGVLSPELAARLPMDRMTRLARGARDMLAGVLDQQMRKIVEFYSAGLPFCLPAGDPLLATLADIRGGGGERGE